MADNEVKEGVPKQHLIGAPAPADTKQERIQKYAEIALVEVEKQSNTPHKHRLVKILEATTQVVAGELVKMKLEVEHDEEQDDGSIKVVTHISQVEVYSRPWENATQVTVKSYDIKE